MRKTMISIAAGATIAAASLLTAGTATASSNDVPAGVHPNRPACAAAGNAGIDNGRWIGWRCQKLPDGVQYLLWVQPR